MKRLPPEERRTKILDRALQLFTSKGYESVRVEDILIEEKLSKGGFYHYFKSKEEVLREIIRKEIERILHVPEKNQDPLTRLLEIFHSGSQWLGAEAGVLSTLNSYSAKSLYLDELESQFEKILKPSLADIISQGISKGLFRKCEPESTTEIFLAVNNYGNRKTILNGNEQDWILSYNRTAFVVLGRHLGIEKELESLGPFST